MTYDDATPREKKISRALAAGMHAAFLLLLVFGVSWQKRVSEPSSVVDLWSTLPPPPREEQPSPPKPVPKVEPKPRPKVEPKPPPKPEAKPTPKPDIALKEKLEKERKWKEQQELERKKELEKKKQEEAKKLEAKKKEEDKRKLEKERLAQEAEAKRLAEEKKALADKLAKAQAAANDKLIADYRHRIEQKVKRYIVEPPNLQGNPEAIFEVRLLPGGEVLEPSIRMKKSSGNAAYDQAVERAIIKASPLPVPPDPALFDTFRNLDLRIRPKE